MKQQPPGELINVTLPNGVVISGIPKGTPKDEIKRKAIAKGIAKESDFGGESVSAPLKSALSGGGERPAPFTPPGMPTGEKVTRPEPPFASAQPSASPSQSLGGVSLAPSFTMAGQKTPQQKVLEAGLGPIRLDSPEAQKVIQAAPSPSPVDYGTRVDGTKKGTGFLGEIKLPGGEVATEVSVGVNINGKEVEIPTLVPTLSNEQKAFIASGGDPRTRPDIIDVAVDHATKRIAKGMSPFNEPSASPLPSLGGPSAPPSATGAGQPSVGVDGAGVAQKYLKSAGELEKWQKYRDDVRAPMDKKGVHDVSDARLGIDWASGATAGIYNTPEYKAKVKQADDIFNAFDKQHKADIEQASRFIESNSDKYIKLGTDATQAQAMNLMKKDAVGGYVIDEDKIRSIAESESRKLGVEGTAFEKLYYNKLKEKVNYGAVEKNVQSVYEKKAKDIYSKYGIDFDEDDRLIANANAKLNSLGNLYKEETNVINAQLEQEITPIRNQFKQEADQINSTYQQSIAGIQQRYDNGLINEQQANVELGQLNAYYEQLSKDYEAKQKAVTEQILRGYNDRYTRANKDYKANYDLEVSRMQSELSNLEKKWKGNEQLSKELKSAYIDAYGQVVGAVEKAKLDMANPAFAGLASFFKGSGGAIKAFASAFSDDPGPMYAFGDYLENRYVTEQVDISSFKSWLPGEGLGTLTGQLASTMLPGTGAAFLASSGVGAPAAAAAAGAIASAFVNAMQVSGQAKDDAFARTGSEVEANRAFDESIKSQIAYAPLAFADALPFVKGIALGGTTRLGIAARKGLTELGAETVQEKFESSTEKSILQGGGAFDRLGQDLLDLNDWKQQVIGVGPAAFLGFGGGLTSRSRGDMANEYLAQQAADRIDGSYQNAWVARGVFENPKMARAAIDMMFSSGHIDQKERASLIAQFDAVQRSKDQAESFGLNEQQQFVFSSVSGRLAELQQKLAAEQDPVAKKVLEDRVKTMSDGLVEFANNKGGAYYVITGSNGVPMVQTESGMNRLLDDKEFADSLMGAGNISIQSFGKADPETQNRVSEFIKGKEAIAQENKQKPTTDAVQKPTTAQVGAQPSRTEGPRKEGGGGVRPGVEGTEATQANGTQTEVDTKDDTSAEAIAINDIASAVEDKKVRGVLVDGKVSDVVYSWDEIDADYGRIKALAERGKLTREALVKSAWGSALATNDLDVVANRLNNNPNAVDRVHAAIDARLNKLTTQPTPAAPAPTTKAAPAATTETIAAPKAETLNTVDKLARAEKNASSSNKSVATKGRNAIQKMLDADPRLAEVNAKFDQMVTELESSGKLTRRCP
jgi:hypothetical protein